MSLSFHPGQRWTSESEPELGLGSVRNVTTRTVVIAFAASGETREYARDNAPLRRARFRPGDTIRTRRGEALVVTAVREIAGLLQYGVEGREIGEGELADALSASQPDERLRAGRMDPPETFDLRVAALGHQHRRRQSAVRGFVGGRIDLIPHQLYIASEVTGRLLPRVLLADEVGLGKTIEACLIVHRLLLTGRAARVLILVPESLVHQWFVELLRRFNLWFHIFDEDRCRAIEQGGTCGGPSAATGAGAGEAVGAGAGVGDVANPFLDDQLVLASLSLVTTSGRRLEQALAAGWDLVVVDEAHHLEWSPDAAGADYAAVEALGRRSPGLLLLTATPEQLGVASHFARLRLLDPDRFHDLAEFEREAGAYREVARLAELVVRGAGASGGSVADAAALARVLDRPEPEVRAALEACGRGDAEVRDELIEALLDQHGTGRVMFRNTRATISGFPRRVPHLVPLAAPTGWSAAATEAWWHGLALEFAADTEPGAVGRFVPAFGDDPRVEWLAGLLRRLGGDKVLLICRTRAKVEALEAALRRRIEVPMAVFHEGLTLVKRDRNAAWFAEEDGAQLLLCSEIGSEGRNFQFAHHLVLFDLPLDPELLEQRLGRLDRIGQRSEIQIHVPYVEGGPQEVLARWCHEGLNAFARNLQGGRELRDRFGARVHDLAQDYHETAATARGAVEALIAETAEARDELAARLEQGRDRLLELNSFRAPVASGLVSAIRAQDDDRSLDEFLLAVFDHYTIHAEELTRRTYQLGSAGVFADTFPGLPPDGLVVTCDRARALAREDVQFLTWDHPLVTGALDLLLGSGAGNCSFAHWPDPRATGLYVEAVYVLECVAPSALHADRFLPPTPVRVVIDHRGTDVTATLSASALAGRLRAGDPEWLMSQPEVAEELVPALLTRAERLAAGRMDPIVSAARRAMNARLGHEIARLRELQKVNRSVRPEEISLLEEQQRDLDRLLAEARLRLDAVRLIQRSNPDGD